MVKCGVIQGCPLGATLFVIGMEPFVRMFMARVEDPGLGIVRLCADDVGIVLKSWQSLTVVFHIFRAAEAAAALSLKPRKCTLVPLSSPLSLHVRSLISLFLSSHIPSWQGFKIESAAEYLGIWIGPDAAVHNWTASICKFITRTRIIADAQCALGLS
eukprot:3707055-Karenia_brevis.AAC.1